MCIVSTLSPADLRNTSASLPVPPYQLHIREEFISTVPRVTPAVWGEVTF